MRYALAPYVGRGTSPDPFRPLGSDQPRWASIDLRPDATRRDGYALVATPERVLGAIDLGPSPDDRWSMRSLASRLGVTLGRSNLRTAAASLLIRDGREDGTRWRPLWPEGQRYRIWLGGLLWEMPALAGGSTFSETWSTGDSASLTSDQTWTETTGTGWEIVSNRARVNGGSATAVARCDTALATADHEVTIDLVTWTYVGSALLFEICCRKPNDAALTWYAHQAFRNSSGSINEHRLSKFIAAAETVLGTDTTDVAAGVTLAVKAVGSSITSKRAGSINLGPVTDTAITSNVRIAMHAFASFGNLVEVDNLVAADVATLGQRRTLGELGTRSGSRQVREG